MCEQRAPRRAAVAAVIAGMTLGVAAAGNGAALPDPTQPPLVHQAAIKRLNLENPQQFTVSAIKISGGRRKAIVNNRLVSAGDIVDQGLIVEISPGVVTIDYLSRRLQVSLLSSGVRRHRAITEATTR